MLVNGKKLPRFNKPLVNLFYILKTSFADDDSMDSVYGFLFFSANLDC